MEDGFVLVPKPDEEQIHPEATCEYLPDIDQFLFGLEPSLWCLNSFLHNNPELGYKEHKAHNVLTCFMQSQKGWHVTRSAYGMETAWVAVYDSGHPGPVVSFNAEMGMPLFPPSQIHHSQIQLTKYT